MIDRRGFFSHSLKAAAATLVCAAAIQVATVRAVAGQAVAGQAVPVQAAAPNHPRRAARASSPVAAQDASAGRANAAPTPRAGLSSPVSVADSEAVRNHRRSRISHAASRGQGGIAVAASLD